MLFDIVSLGIVDNELVVCSQNHHPLVVTYHNIGFSLTLYAIRFVSFPSSSEKKNLISSTSRINDQRLSSFLQLWHCRRFEIIRKNFFSLSSYSFIHSFILLISQIAILVISYFCSLTFNFIPVAVNIPFFHRNLTSSLSLLLPFFSFAFHRGYTRKKAIAMQVVRVSDDETYRIEVALRFSGCLPFTLFDKTIKQKGNGSSVENA